MNGHLRRRRILLALVSFVVAFTLRQALLRLVFATATTTVLRIAMWTSALVSHFIKM